VSEHREPSERSESAADTMTEATIDADPDGDAGPYGPVTDWATDLDHADPEYTAGCTRSGVTSSTAAARSSTPIVTAVCGLR